MKRLLTVSVLVALVSVAFASTAIWSRTTKPPLSLTEAVEFASKTLNKDGGEFYCLGASICQSGGQCVWDLDFGSTNAGSRWVQVGADKSLRVRKDGPFVHY